MKKFILVAAFISANSFAATVNGDTAQALRKALINAGASPKIYTDASFVKVSSVKCSQNGGIVLLPFKCQFIEDGRLVENNLGNKSQALAEALKEAGAKVVSSRMAEKSSEIVTAKAVECSTMAMHHMISCTITK